MKYCFSELLIPLFVLVSFSGYSQSSICQNNELEYEITIDSLTCNDWEGQIFLDLTSGEVESYFWIGPAAFFSIDQSPEIEFPGNYFLTITGSDGCITRDTIIVEYNTEAFNHTLSVPTITCVQPEVEIDIDPAPSNYNYEWERKNDASFSAPNASSITVDDGGIYFVTITRPSDNCEVKEWTVVLVDTLSPILSFEVDKITCEMDEVVLQSDLNAWEITSVTWSGPGINISNENELFPIVSEAGEYTITGFGANGCPFSNTVFVESEIISIIVYEDADDDGFGNPSILMEACEIPEGYSTISGDCNDQDPIINPIAEDIDANGIDENCDGIDGPSSLIEFNSSEFVIFPNPVIDMLRIKSTHLDFINYDLYSMEGSKIMVGRVKDEINISMLESGLYILKISNSDGVTLFTKKLVKL